MSRTQVADMIKDGLLHLRLSKQDFAERMGVPPSVVSRWVSGKNNFTIDILFRIEQVLGIQIFTFSPTIDKSLCYPCLNAPLIPNNPYQ